MRKLVAPAVALTAFWSFAEVRPEDHPIGVLDSGVGGLPVLESLLTNDAFDNVDGTMHPDGRPDFEDEDFVYFADSPRGRVTDGARFVLGSDRHLPSKVLVIASDAAAACELGADGSTSRLNDAEVVGVVDAGVDAALDALKWVKTPYAIAVMATPETISSGVYERTIRAKLKERLVDTPVQVVNRGGLGLAEAIGNRDLGMRECARTNLVAMVEAYRARGGRTPIRAMILGCAHYSHVLDTFDRTLQILRRDPKYARLIAEDFRFVDPVVHTSIACYRSLRRQVLLSQDGPTRKDERRVNAFISAGKGDSGAKVVPLARDTMPSDAAGGIGKTCPACRRELGL